MLPLERAQEQLRIYRDMREIDFIVEKDAGGGLVGRALGQTLVTQAADQSELCANVQDATRCHFDVGSAPEIIRLRFIQAPGGLTHD